MSRKLVLVLRPVESPLIAWPGFCDAAQESLLSLTGCRLEPFTLMRQELHEQYFLDSSVEPLRNWFTSLPPARRLEVARQMYEAYYGDATALRDFTSKLTELNLATASTTELDRLVQEWMVLPGRLAGPIWFSVLIDIWFTDPNQIQDVVQIAAKARDDCSTVYDAQAKPEAKRLFSEIATRLGASWGELEMLFPEEILAWLHGDTSVAARVARRREFFVTTNDDNGKYAIFDGVEASTRASDVLLAELGRPQDQLVGLPNGGGTVSGQARRVFSPEGAEFGDGEILVAYQTNPTYVPLFKRAAAVVTELGGATSHAAVVCAEMKIPCVVGVANLLVSVADGDQLTVDATAGTISIHRAA